MNREDIDRVLADLDGSDQIDSGRGGANGTVEGSVLLPKPVSSPYCGENDEALQLAIYAALREQNFIYPTGGSVVPGPVVVVSEETTSAAVPVAVASLLDSVASRGFPTPPTPASPTVVTGSLLADVLQISERINRIDEQKASLDKTRQSRMIEEQEEEELQRVLTETSMLGIEGEEVGERDYQRLVDLRGGDVTEEDLIATAILESLKPLNT